MSLSDSDRKRLADEIASALSRAKDGNRTVPYAASVEIDPVNLPGWLIAPPRKSLWYWRSRDGHIEVGGIGDGLTIPGGDTASSLDQMQKLQEKCPHFRPPVICARRFGRDDRYDDTQRFFQADICRVPTRMVVRRNDRYTFYLTVNIRPDTETRQILDAVEYGIGETTQKNNLAAAYSLPAIAATSSFPNRDGWRMNITRALSAIDRNDIDKIVLARRLDYHFEERIDPVSLLMSLGDHNRSCFSIIHQPRPGIAFISVSPERLYRRDARTITVDAISSTMPRGATPDEDASLERQLLHDDKLRREHRFVSDTVLTDLTSLCDGEPAVDGPRALKLDRIQHIVSTVTGRLKPDTDDSRIVATLHPTPAVAGVPREKAIKMIVETEPFVRGWYAGAIGVIDGDRAEFAVGIRSAIVHDDRISVFTGAGIVQGSDPDREWDEIESKDILRPMLSEKALS